MSLIRHSNEDPSLRTVVLEEARGERIFRTSRHE
jgi:hypothetical protein